MADAITAPLRVRECFAWAVRRAATSGLSPRGVLLTLALAAPLYAIGYAGGSFAWLGWVYSLLAGALGVAILVGWAQDDEMSLGETGLVALQSIGGHAFAFALGFGVTYGATVWVLLAWAGDVMPAAAAAVLSNGVASWWKPIAHVAAFGALFFGAFPVTLLAVVTRIRQSMPPRLAMSWSRKVLQERVYERWRLLAAAHVLAALAFVPVLGLFVLPIAAWMTIRFYQHAFSWKSV
jgi:hypothetical protein